MDNLEHNSIWKDAETYKVNISMEKTHKENCFIVALNFIALGLRVADANLADNIEALTSSLDETIQQQQAKIMELERKLDALSREEPVTK